MSPVAKNFYRTDHGDVELIEHPQGFDTLDDLKDRVESHTMSGKKPITLAVCVTPALLRQLQAEAAQSHADEAAEEIEAWEQQAVAAVKELKYDGRASPVWGDIVQYLKDESFDYGSKLDQTQFYDGLLLAIVRAVIAAPDVDKDDQHQAT